MSVVIKETYFDNGQLKERSSWKHGKLDGLRELWFESGQIKEKTNWKSGKCHGLCEYYCVRTGTMITRSNWQDGQKHGLFENWYRNGNIKHRINYYNDIRHGLCEIYDTNCVRKAFYYMEEEQYLEVRIVGKLVLKHVTNNYNEKDWDYTIPPNVKIANRYTVKERYFDDGQLQEKSHWYNNKQEGKTVKWFIDGKVLEEINYLDGVFHGKNLVYDIETGEYIPYYYLDGMRIPKEWYDCIIDGIVDIFKIPGVSNIVVAYFF